MVGPSIARWSRTTAVRSPGRLGHGEPGQLLVEFGTPDRLETQFQRGQMRAAFEAHALDTAR